MPIRRTPTSETIDELPGIGDVGHNLERDQRLLANVDRANHLSVRVGDVILIIVVQQLLQSSFHYIVYAYRL